MPLTYVECRDCVNVWAEWGSYCRLVARLPLPADVTYRRQFTHSAVVDGHHVDVLGCQHEQGRCLVQDVTTVRNKVTDRGAARWVLGAALSPGGL